MEIGKVNLIYYSPTGTSKKVLEGIMKGLDVSAVEHIDLTPLKGASGSFAIPAGELSVFAVPVYGGRVPLTAAQRLKAVKGNGTPAVLVVVYGNRAFDDALVELRDISASQGFTALAGAAFIGEHSFSSDSTPIATGRPDPRDLAKAEKFGELVRAKLEGSAKPVEVTLPGNRPYMVRGPSVPRSPDTTVESCTLCGVCADVCPTKSITVSDKVETLKETCTACSACVKVCPTSARVWTNEGVLKAAAWLNKEYNKRREPEFFL